MGDQSDMDFEHHISPFSSQYSLSKTLINATFRISGLTTYDNCCSCCVRETDVIPTGGVMSQFSNVYSRLGLYRIFHPLALVLALDVDNFVISQNDHNITIIYTTAIDKCESEQETEQKYNRKTHTLSNA